MKGSPETSGKTKFMHPDEQKSRFAAKHLPEPITKGLLHYLELDFFDRVYDDCARFVAKVHGFEKHLEHNQPHELFTILPVTIEEVIAAQPGDTFMFTDLPIDSKSGMIHQHWVISIGHGNCISKYAHSQFPTSERTRNVLTKYDDLMTYYRMTPKNYNLFKE